MLCLDLSVTLTIMISALVLNHGSAAKEMGRERTAESRGHPLQWGLRHHQNNPQPCGSCNFLHNVKKERRLRNLLKQVIITLKNVIDKYELRKEELKALYEGAVGCGEDNCEKFPGVIPEGQRLNHLRCRCLNERMMMGHLSHFRAGVQRIKKSFQVLIGFERRPVWTNENRLKILKELKTDIKQLNLEIKSAMTDKGQDSKLETKSIESSFPPPKSHTDLKIYEWRIIQGSRAFLQEWEGNLQKVIRCWKKRKQKTSKSAISPACLPLEKIERLRQRERVREEMSRERGLHHDLKVGLSRGVFKAEK